MTKQSSPTSANSNAKKTLSFGQNILLLLLAGVLLLGVSGFYWYKYVLTDPDRVLQGMIDKSLQTSSVTRQITQASSGSDVRQDIVLSFAPSVLAHSNTNLTQNSGNSKTTVVTESYGTKDTDYVRYTKIDVQGGQKRNFDKVLNTWGKRNADPEKGQQATFLNDALFLVVPFGNLTDQQRKDLKAEVDKVNLYQTREAKVSYEHGRPVVDYTFKIDPKALVQVLAKYVSITGIGDAAELDPTSYEGADKVEVKIKVDALSRHLKTVNFGESGRSEVYRAYNLITPIDNKLPSKTISVDELQGRLTQFEN